MAAAISCLVLLPGCGQDENQDSDGDPSSEAPDGGGSTENGSGGATASGGSSAGGAATQEHLVLTHTEHAALAPSPEHLEKKEEHLAASKDLGPTSPAPAPKAERQLFATGAQEGADGHLWLYDPYCRIQDDGVSCPDSWAVCGFEHCSTYTPTEGFHCPGCSSSEVVGLTEVDDPCGRWYWDKSDPKLWALRAQDAFEKSDTVLQEIILAESGTGYGYVECREMCLADEECVGGMVVAYSKDPQWTIHCVLLKESSQELAPGGEERFPIFFNPADLNQQIDDMFAPAWSTHAGIFSVCDDPQASTVSP